MITAVKDAVHRGHDSGLSQYRDPNNCRLFPYIYIYIYVYIYIYMYIIDTHVYMYVFDFLFPCRELLLLFESGS